MGHPNVVLQSVRVFESCSTITALKLGVIVPPAVLQKSYLVLEQKWTLVALKPHSFVHDRYVAIQVPNLRENSSTIRTGIRFAFRLSLLVGRFFIGCGFVLRICVGISVDFPLSTVVGIV